MDKKELLRNLVSVDRKRGTLTADRFRGEPVRSAGNSMLLFWSGGKESAYLLQIALAGKYGVRTLLNLTDRQTGFSISAPFNPQVIVLQGECLGIRIEQPCLGDDYNADLGRLLDGYRKQGIDRVGAGYIAPFGQRDCVLEKLHKRRMGVFEPFSGEASLRHIQDLLCAKTEAVVVGVDIRKIDRRWLGAAVDKKFLQYIRGLKGVDPSGENNEYQTCVVDCKLFKKKLFISRSRAVEWNGFAFLYPEKVRCISKTP